MNRKLVLVLVVIGGLALAGAVSLGLAQEPEPAVPPSSADGPEQPGVPPESLGPPEVREIEGSGAGVDSPPEAWLRVAGSVLRPREDNVSYDWGSGGGCIYASSGDDFTIWNTPVSLPHGAEVRRLRMYYYDNNASNDCRGWFTVYDLYGNVADEWLISSSGTPEYSYSTTALFSHVVNYESYSYALNWRPNELGSDMMLCGFRIYYEPPPFGLSFLPLTMKNHSP